MTESELSIPQEPTNHVPQKQAFRIALLASLPLTVLALVSGILQSTDNITALFISIVLSLAMIGVFYWWQIKDVRRRLAADNFDVPSYWQVLFLFLLFGMVSVIAAIPLAIGLAAVFNEGQIVDFLPGAILQIFTWVFTAFLVSYKLGNPFEEQTSKTWSIVLIVLTTLLVVMAILFILLAIGLSSG